MTKLLRELRRCWISLLGAALVSAGYLLLGHHQPLGWLAVAAANAAMLALAFVTRQWGLLVAVLPMGLALSNFRSAWS